MGFMKVSVLSLKKKIHNWSLKFRFRLLVTHVLRVTHTV